MNETPEISTISAALQEAREELVEAIDAIETAAGASSTAGYVPSDAIDVLSSAAAELEGISEDPTLLLGGSERSRFDDVLDRTGFVLRDMNPVLFSGSSVGLHYQYLRSATRSLEELGNQIDLIQDTALLLHDESSSGVKVVQTASQRLLATLGDDPNEWLRLGPRGFEELLAEIWTGLGWETVLTPPTNDGGFDVRAIRNENGVTVCYLLQAKAFNPARPVRIDEVRKLYGVVEENGATHGIVATTSRFTPPAQEKADSLRYRVSLADFTRVLDWVEAYRSLRGGV